MQLMNRTQYLNATIKFSGMAMIIISALEDALVLLDPVGFL